MTIWKLKSCPHFGGDIYIEKDSEEWYEHCLQCGTIKDQQRSHEIPLSDPVSSAFPDMMTTRSQYVLGIKKPQ